MSGESNGDDDEVINASLGYYRVKEGDCIGSIAYEHGFLWKTLWNHPNNRLLKERRKNPNTLHVGDGVFIPDLQLRNETRPTEKRHTFKRKGVPAHIYLRLMFNHQPRRKVEYQLVVEGTTFTGRTNSDGELHHAIPPNAKDGILYVKNGARWEQTNLDLGSLRPAQSTDGARARLANLGYDPGAADDDDARAALNAAINRFQEKEKIDTSAPPEDTLEHLEDLHDSAEAHRAANQNDDQGNQWKIHPDAYDPGEPMFDPLSEEDFEASADEDDAVEAPTDDSDLS